MKEILQNKLLIIFLIVFTLIGTMCSSVYASSDLIYKVKNLDGLELTFNVPSDLRANYKYVYITQYNFSDGTRTDYTVCFSDVALFADVSSHVIRLSKDYNSSFPKPANSIKWYVFDDEIQSKTSFSMEDNCDFYENIIEGTSDILYSNVDVYDYNNPDKLVFQGAPQMEVELVQAMKVEEIPQKIIQIIMIILPIFLLIFGTLLVIYLIRLKNLFQI